MNFKFKCIAIMKNSSIRSTTTRAPLSTIKPSNNSLVKHPAQGLKDSKPVVAPRASVTAKPNPPLLQSNTKRESIQKVPITSQSTNLFSQNDIIDQQNSDFADNEVVQHKPVENVTKDTRESQLNQSNVDVIINDHEICFEKQKELIGQLKTENDVQSEDMVKLRVEISRWKEALAKSDAEIAVMKEKNQTFGIQQSGQDEVIMNLRREIVLLQKKNESNHDIYTQQQFESIKLRREICELKGQREELRAVLTRERNEKEGFWQQLQDEQRRQKGLLESSSKFKEENRALELLIEKMREELHALRVSNEEVLKHLTK